MAAIINAQGRFGLPAWAPVANNVIVIAAALMYLLVGGTGSVTGITTSELVILGLGTTLGIARPRYRGCTFQPCWFPARAAEMSNQTCNPIGVYARTSEATGLP